MLTTLKNGRLTVTADTRGAELQTIDKDGGPSYLWSGDPAFWAFHAPTLFPIIGALRGGRALSAGGEISLPKHGFCRTAEFALEDAGDTFVTYRLTDSDATRNGYRCAFCLWVRSSLDGASVETRDTVTNRCAQALAFLLGGHPAFRVPLSEGETLEDYLVEFPEKETLDCPQVELGSGLIMDTVRNRFLTDRSSFALNHVLFRGDALIFDDLRSRSVSMRSVKSGRGVRLDFPDMPYLAIWTPVVDSPFVCLEPWTGMGTRVSEDDRFEHKLGAKILKPGEEQSLAFTITVF